MSDGRTPSDNSGTLATGDINPLRWEIGKRLVDEIDKNELHRVRIGADITVLSAYFTTINGVGFTYIVGYDSSRCFQGSIESVKNYYREEIETKVAEVSEFPIGADIEVSYYPSHGDQIEFDFDPDIVDFTIEGGK